MRKSVKIIALILVFCILAIAVFVVAAKLSSKITYKNPDDYSKCRSGEFARKQFKDKLGMDESIFPAELKESYDVKDFIMVYHNPFDPQYLGYMDIEYSEEDYIAEVKRVKEYPSTDYAGVYGTTGFSDYELLAINADSKEYYGIIYALTDGKSRIIYIELIFCNYFMDLDYTEYIPQKYLPDGFNALPGNPTREKFEAGKLR